MMPAPSRIHQVLKNIANSLFLEDMVTYITARILASSLKILVFQLLHVLYRIFFVKTLLFSVVFLLVFSVSSPAGRFTVTTSADSGPGSFREAISLSNANGTSVNDSIVFNLPDISAAGRKIILLSALPPLSSHLVIDGTSQPGNAFGVSEAKVMIQYLYTANTPQTVFTIDHCTDISIYGLKVDNQVTWTAYYEETVCFDITSSDHINIGDKGKGNLFINWIHTILMRSPEGSKNKDIKIRSNIFGMEEDGETAAYNEHIMEIDRIENLQVGGRDPAEGNVMAASRRRILVSGTSGTILIANNKIGTNYSGTKMLSMPYGESDLLHDNISILNSMWASEIEYNTDVYVINNLSTGYCSNGIKILGVGKKFYIQGNKIGTDISGIQQLTPGMDCGILIENCRDGIIGFDKDEMKEKNSIAFAKRISSASTYLSGDAIAIANTTGVIISRNSIFCDQQQGIGIDTNGAYKAPLITVNTINNNSVTGTAPPHSLIEIFRDDSCPNCEGKTYLETIFADAGGKWTKNGIDPAGLVFTATDPARHMTSEFSAPYMEAAGLKINNATCGKTNGSITGWKILSGTRWYWEDEAGNVAGTDTNLVNVAPGRYRLVVGIGTEGCTRSTDFFTINGDSLPSSVNVISNPASCGKSNGSLQATTDPYLYNFKWLNNASDSVFGQPFYPEARPSNYMLKLALISDSSCNKLYGPFTVGNASGPDFNTSLMKISPANCGGSSGSITGITLSNTTGVAEIAWVNAAGVVAKTLNLIDQPPGKYTLTAIDASGCDTVKTDAYTIPSSGDISIDTSGIRVQPLGCDGKGGNISGISVSGADSYKWINTASGQTAGNDRELMQQPPGSYQLIASNTKGCSDTAGIFIIAKALPDPIHITKQEIRPAYCNADNGSIAITDFDKDSSGYSFQWFAAGNVTPISSALQAQNLSAGDYLLVATDKNQCRDTLNRFTIEKVPAPSIQGVPDIIPEKCDLANGSISNIQIAGLQGSTSYQWTDSNNVSVSNEPDARALKKGLYRLEITDAGFCMLRSPFYRVPGTQSPVSAARYEPVTIPKNTFAAITVLNPEPASYELYSDALGATLIDRNTTGTFNTPVLQADTSFYVLKRVGSCLSPLTQVNITVIDKTAVFVPNAFTPNNDGVNDVLHLRIVGLMRLNYFKIYNRFGNMIFSTADAIRGWDGMYKGKDAPPGNYVWVAAGTDVLGQPYSGKGTFLLVR